MKINPKLSSFLEAEGLSKDTKLYRFSLAEYVRKDEGGRYFISANPEPTEMIKDIYESGHSMMAKFINKGLAFTAGVEESFKTDEHVLVVLKLEKILEQEGLIYPDVSSFTDESNAYFVTIPQGEIEVKKLE